ncbi:hypothetical protein ANCDUO_05001 [Ancylostoma duodenale]|uniref:Uncharacterized protein n=1 Tax=Ancylostoma duodenale TaxID=51022 RepID=A0A0C2GTQ3_9BILA|nr:hypothetical protein ANCDUO_05001 [Ancylostoma duodenale]
MVEGEATTRGEDDNWKAKTKGNVGLGRNHIAWQGSTHLRARRSQAPRTPVLRHPGKHCFALGPTVGLSPQRPGHWPANSSGLAQLEYSIWGVLESIAYAELHSTAEALKRDLTRAWNNLPMDSMATAVDEFPRRLKKCIEASNGHFEQH